jgi:Flp pilus assembly protein TadG
MSQKRKRGQTMVEMAMVAPIFFVLLTAVFDFGRAAYTWSVLGAAAREGGRVSVVNGPGALLPTDDTVINAAKNFGFGLALSGAVNGASTCTHGRTTSPLTPAPSTANTGYIYIVPASGTANSPAGGGGAQGAGCNAVVRVGPDATALKVVIVYKFVPFTPFANQFMNNGLTFTASSVMYTEY